MIDVLILVALVAAIVFATAKLKISPFLALIGAAIIGGFAFRLPTADIVPTILTSFGNTMGNIGLVILFGTMIGLVLERSGGAISMADALIKVLGTRFPNLTMSVIGYIVAIPVFCDSGFIILNSLRKAIAVRAKVSPVGMAVALMTGLYATHTMVPPTPGPLAAAGELGVIEDLGLVIGLGLPIAAVAGGAALLFASSLRRKSFELLPKSSGEPELDQSYEELRASYGTLPPASLAFLPILVPIVLICLASFGNLPSAPFGEGTLLTALQFVGSPSIALIIGFALGVLLLRGKGRLEQFNDIVTGSIGVAAPILLITAAGAAFGGVLGASELTGFIADNLSTLGLGIFVPFIIAAALKTAQGSSTVAIITTAALVAPMLESLGLGETMGAVLTVFAIGAGAMVVSHANDSYFWVVSQLSRIPVATAYRTLTPATAIEGVAAILATWVVSLIAL
ncbi:GntP family permease [Georgenia sp. Marseille-Q6866]